MRISILPQALLLVSISLCCLSFHVGIATLETESYTMAKRATCAPCPPIGKTGDPRCKVSTISGTIDTATGCPSCGCQKCPNLHIYANHVTNYCSSKPSNTCGHQRYVCRTTCALDKRCTPLSWDPDLGANSIICQCPCQVCPNGLKYHSTNDYTKATALSASAQQACPNVIYPIQKYKGMCGRH